MKILLLLISFSSFGKVSYYVEDNIFIQGYDPVSYITQSKAVRGVDSIKLKHDGTPIHFSSMENKELFLKEPNKYLPAYNGWCAYAMSKGELVEINPEFFKVVNGKTHLFFKNWLFNTLESWNEKESELKPKADKNWKLLLEKK